MVVEEKIVKSDCKAADVLQVSVGALFLQKFDELADKEILVDVASERIWSGRALKDAVLKVAEAFIKDVGLKKGQTVNFYCPNNDYHVIAQLAVMAAGGVYTGCDSRLPFRDLMECIENTETTYLICHRDNLEVAVKVAGTCNITKVIVMEASPEVLAKHSVCIPFQRLWNFAHAKDVTIPVEADIANDVARLLLSSGTTGIPKAVVRTHANLVNFLTQFAQPGISLFNPGDVTICFEPISLILGTIVLWSGLMTGAKTLVLPYFEPDMYLQAVTKYKVTSLVTVPSRLITILNKKRTGAFDTSSVRDIITFGGFLAPTAAQEVATAFALPAMRQGYALAEVGMVTITPKGKNCPKTIGLPLPGIEIKIADLQSGAALAAEDVGEIRLRSLQATTKYSNNPAASAELLDEEKFLKTGDVGYYDNNGFLYIVDRIKEVIKVKGRQVAPAELEALLDFQESVKESAVVGVKDETFGEVPKAYVVLNPGFDITKNHLIDYIASQVADWKQLRGGLEFKLLLPKTENGKIDRHKLREMLMA